MSKEHLVNELHTSARKNFKRRKVIIKGINDLWQADLVEMIPYKNDNRGFRYLLTVIDAFSKFAWGIPVKSKSGSDVSKAMEKILINQSPINLQTDLGKEFYNTFFKNLMNRYKINHFSTYSSLKASIVERFNRTLKNWMWKLFSLNGNYKWINNLQFLIDKYNNTVHRTIKMKPINVNTQNEKKLLQTVYNNNNKIKTFRKPKFHVGDKVRISKYKHMFEKGYTPNWTTEVFEIHKIQITDPVTYILKDYQGHIIRGSFYEQELLKAKFPNTYLIQKILRKKGDSLYVKWLGFSNEHNSWIKKADLSA